jgi:hypothetical protein
MAAKSKSAQDKSAKDKSPRIAIGLRVKTGRATAVVMTGPASAPRVLSRKSLQLWDPAVPESHQPWHAEFELPAEESALIVPKALEAVERVALSALRELVGEVQTGQGAILGISLVEAARLIPNRFAILTCARMLAKASSSRMRWPRPPGRCVSRPS